MQINPMNIAEIKYVDTETISETFSGNAIGTLTLSTRVPSGANIVSARVLNDITNFSKYVTDVVDIGPNVIFRIYNVTGSSFTLNNKLRIFYI